MPRALTLSQRTRDGMDGGKLPIGEVTSARRFDPNMNRFMRDAWLAGVLELDKRYLTDEKTAVTEPPEEVEAPATLETVSKPVGEMATSAVAVLNTDVSEELIAEINASVEVEPTTV